MEHNFADWELTKLLPENKSKEHVIYSDGWVISTTVLQYRTMREGEFYAWTWEDIRLFLKKNGFRIVENINPETIDFFCFDVWKWKNGYEGIEIASFDAYTYEDARRRAIIYCLNRIKEKRN